MGVMRTIIVLVTIFFGEGILGMAHGKESYNLKDLEILEEQRNYPDFFLHAKDIRPALRGEYWKKMVRHMAVGWVDYKLKRNIFDGDSFGKIEGVAVWPTLQTDKFFQLKRGDYALKVLEHCFSSRDKEHPVCLGWMEQFWVRSNRTASVGYRLAKLLMEQKHSGGWRYISDILLKEEAKIYCGKKLLQDEFLKAMKKVSNSAYGRSEIDKFVHPICWKAMVPGLKKRLLENSHSKSGTMEERVFKILASKGELARSDEDFYFVLFILNGPRVGKTFNQAWNRMKILGEDFSRRQKVLKRLAKLDPLPDGVVGISSPNKRKTLLNFLSRYFPEYFNHYVKICLNYLEGKGSFPQGNPTIRCREFFRYTDSLVSDRLYLRYSALKKKGYVVD